MALLAIGPALPAPALTSPVPLGCADGAIAYSQGKPASEGLGAQQRQDCLQSDDWACGSLGEVSAADEGHVGDGDTSGRLCAAVRAALLTEHSCLPALRGGLAARRAWLRIVSSLALAISTIFVALLARGHPECGISLFGLLVLSSTASWAIIAVESVAQRANRWRQVLESQVAAFEDRSGSGTVSSGGETVIGNSSGIHASRELGAVFEGVEVEDDDSDDCHVSSVTSLPSDIAAQRLVQEYGRLAPSAQVVSVQSPPLSEAVAGSKPAGRGMRSSLSVPSTTGKVVETPGTVAAPFPREQSTVSMSAASGKTGSTLSARTASARPSSSKASKATQSSRSRSLMSLLSLKRHAPQVEIQEPCDLESLKLRYIESISSKRDAEPDRRIDNFDAPPLSLQRLEEVAPSLQITCWCMCLAVVSMVCLLVLSLHDGCLQSCWPMPSALLGAAGGWLVAVFAFDVATVCCTAVHRWRAVEGRIAARRDQRWQKVAHQRAQKAHAMERAVCAP
mmetsp:Transcript_56019/g.133465  ORF Transcript_56019/g.133465 Transcript_56019/m.133465 type:complete len:508 (+) Transcript_56019:89-1612(+)